MEFDEDLWKQSSERIKSLGLETQEMYVQGMSTSLPVDVQVSMLRTLPGLERTLAAASETPGGALPAAP